MSLDVCHTGIFLAKDSRDKTKRCQNFVSICSPINLFEKICVYIVKGLFEFLFFFVF